MGKIRLQQRIETYNDSLYLAAELQEIARSGLFDEDPSECADKFVLLDAAQNLEYLYRLARTLTAYVVKNERRKTRKNEEA